MLMPVPISRGEFVVDSERSRQRGYSQEDQRKNNGHHAAAHLRGGSASAHRGDSIAHQWRRF